MTNRVVVAPLVLVEVACVRIAVGQHHPYTYRVLRFLIRRYRPFFFFCPPCCGKIKKKEKSNGKLFIIHILTTHRDYWFLRRPSG